MKRENLNDAIMNAIDNEYDVYIAREGTNLFFAIDAEAGGGPIEHHNLIGDLPEVILNAIDNGHNVLIDHIDVPGDCVGKFVFIIDAEAGGGPVSYYDLNGRFFEIEESID